MKPVSPTTLSTHDIRTLRAAWSIARSSRNLNASSQTANATKVSIAAVMREQWDRAHQSPRGHSAATIEAAPADAFRHSIVAITAGNRINEHHGLGTTTVHVLVGRVRVACATESSEASSGELLVLPQAPHSVTALEDSAVLLTIATPAQENPRAWPRGGPPTGR